MMTVTLLSSFLSVVVAFAPISSFTEKCHYKRAVVPRKKWQGQQQQYNDWARSTFCFMSIPSNVVRFIKENAAIEEKAQDNHGGDEAERRTFEVEEVEGPFTSESFVSSKAWGRHPLLIRNAFSLLHDDEDSTPWPNPQELMSFATEEHVESRLVTHVPGDDNSWKLQLGPLLDDDNDAFLQHSNNDEEERWTLIVNDVDTLHPPLSHWIHDTFSFIPRWARDDGQVSLSNNAGGIGPHVDNYHVFLIQTRGCKEWEIGTRFISVYEELSGLISDLDVRILSFWSHDKNISVTTLNVRPGDVLYLPPRVGHCGTASTDECMTLSVGCKSVSTGEMIGRLVEHVCDDDGIRMQQQQFDDFQWNNNNDPCSSGGGSEITKDGKSRAKQLIQTAISTFLQDEMAFDEFFGRLLTEPKRVRAVEYPVSSLPTSDYMETDEEERDEEEWRLQSFGGVWGNPKLAVRTVLLDGRGALYSAEGLAWGYSRTRKRDVYHDRLFVDGDMFEIPQTREQYSIVAIIANERRLTRSSFPFSLSTEEIQLLEDLVERGYLYGSNE